MPLRVGLLFGDGCEHLKELLMSFDPQYGVTIECVESGFSMLHQDGTLDEQLANLNRVLVLMDRAERTCEQDDWIVRMVAAREKRDNRDILMFVYCERRPHCGDEAVIRRSGCCIDILYSPPFSQQACENISRQICKAISAPNRFHLASPLRDIADEAALGFYHNFLRIVLIDGLEVFRNSPLFDKKKVPLVLFLLCPRSTRTDCLQNLRCFTEGEEFNGRRLTSTDVTIELVRDYVLQRRYTLGKVYRAGDYRVLMQVPPPISNMFDMSTEFFNGLQAHQLREQQEVFWRSLDRYIEGTNVQGRVILIDFDDTQDGVESLTGTLVENCVKVLSST